jgi:hypothetical protein
LDARQLLTNTMDYPIEIRVSNTADLSAQQAIEDTRKLQAVASKVEDILRSIPIAERTRNEWEQPNAQIILTIDPDHVNLAGITNMDVANSSTAGISTNLEHPPHLVTGRIFRLEQCRTINVCSCPIAWHLSSEALKAAMTKLGELEASLPPGYKIRLVANMTRQETASATSPEIW